MSELQQAVYTAVTYIEDHLIKDITIADIAASSGYSLYHFIRVFNQSAHHTPYDYLIRRRLSEAAVELVTNNQRILDISLQFQFNNHETFSRAFKRMFSIQASKWRERGVIPYQSLHPALSLAYLEPIRRIGIQRPVLVEWETIQLVGLMTQGKVIPTDLWVCFEKIFRNISRLQGNGVLLKRPDLWR
jgi:AraC family transcriptional regulator